jgi:hypothetical protein
MLSESILGHTARVCGVVERNSQVLVEPAGARLMSTPGGSRLEREFRAGTYCGSSQEETLKE